MCRDGCCFRAIDGLVLSDDCTTYGVLSSVCVPDSVRELCDGCFKGCSSLRRVTLSTSSSLERIGKFCCQWSGVQRVYVPDGEQRGFRDVFLVSVPTDRMLLKFQTS